MPRYLISFDAHAMDHIPDDDMPAVAHASLAVVQEAINAGVWVFGGVQTDAPYRSTTSAVPRWCAPCVRSTRTVLPRGSKLPS